MTFAQPRDVSYVGDDRWPPGLVPPELTLARQRPGASASAGSGPAVQAGEPDQAGPGPAALDAHCRILLTAGPESAKAARDFTTETLCGWQLGSLVQEAVLIVTELVTNAIRHGACCASDESGQGQVELAWQRDATRVICVVTDGSARPPVLSPDDPNAESGRGLLVVQALAAAWGWMLLGATQKAVWAAMQLTASR